MLTKMPQNALVKAYRTNLYALCKPSCKFVYCAQDLFIRNFIRIRKVLFTNNLLEEHPDRNPVGHQGKFHLVADS